MVDAYCAHLGAHLGVGGKVEGECIRCPFHGWRYDGESGKCTEIPYGDTEHIPSQAKVPLVPDGRAQPDDLGVALTASRRRRSTRCPRSPSSTTPTGCPTRSASSTSPRAARRWRRTTSTSRTSCTCTAPRIIPDDEFEIQGHLQADGRCGRACSCGRATGSGLGVLHLGDQLRVHLVDDADRRGEREGALDLHRAAVRRVTTRRTNMADGLLGRREPGPPDLGEQALRRSTDHHEVGEEAARAARVGAAVLLELRPRVARLCASRVITRPDADKSPGAPMFSMRFDMRAPDGGATMPGLYDAAIEMAAFGRRPRRRRRRHLRAPRVARRLHPVAAAARVGDGGAHRAPAHHDRGRADAVLRPDPPRRGHGRPRHHLEQGTRVLHDGARLPARGVRDVRRRRGPSAAPSPNEKLGVLLQAVTGEPFEYEGRQVQSRPRRHPGRSDLVGRWHQGGGAPRRAPRDRTLRRERQPGVREAYEDECARARPRAGHVHARAASTRHDRVRRRRRRPGVGRGRSVPPPRREDVRRVERRQARTSPSMSQSRRPSTSCAPSSGAHRIYSVDEAIDIVKGGGFAVAHAAVRRPSARARVEAT